MKLQFKNAIKYVIVNFYAMTVPNRYVREWKASGMKLPLVLYRGLLVISSIAAIILGYFYFTSNNLKLLMIGVTVGISIYSVVLTKFGHIEISAKKEYVENNG